MPDSVVMMRVVQGLFAAWLGMGQIAAVEPHWANQPLRVSQFDTRPQAGWSRGALDRFVAKRLAAQGRTPAPGAVQTALIRRVALDLTGLPPTPQEVDAFLADDAPDAYERVVDRYLRSPDYAERMAIWWLDMARYADTHGYEGDGARQIWLYRDWVIDAFLQGMPFDRFTIDQLAGDLVPQGTEAQRIATGFHRNSPFCYEGGTDLEQFRVEAVVDRVNTTMTVWMGSTFGCAQCHDHKYDAITQEEYFQLFAFFNNATEANGATFSAISPLHQEQAKESRQRMGWLEDRISASDVSGIRRQWWAAQLKRQWRVLPPQEAVSLGGAVMELLPDKSVLVSGKNPAHDRYEMVHEWAGGVFAALGLEVLHHPSLPKQGPGRYEQNGNFGLSTLEIEVADPAADGAWRRVALNDAVASYQEPQDKVVNALNGQSECWCTNQREAQAWFLVAQPFELPAGSRVRVRMTHDSKWQRHGIGRFRLWSSGALMRDDLAPGFPVLQVVKSLLKKEQERTPAEVRSLDAYFRGIDPALAPLRNEIERIKLTLRPVETMVMKEREQPRATHVLVAGSHLNPGASVSADVPQLWHKWENAWPRNRLGLARWLMAPENPRVGRVTSNRIWAMLFGQGLVSTSEDFGVQGAPPTHPLLLDYLAAHLVRTGWNLQALQRQIVTSATYRQSSDVPAGAGGGEASDPWLGRGPAFRLDAECIRDNALAVSGLLDRRVGGPGVYPYQPQGVYEQIHSYTTSWATSTQGQQYRRGLYTWWKRTAPYPSMIAFDAPRRNVCTERRPRTNTPLQALVTLNDPVFVQCAAALARRMQLRDDGSAASGVRFGFRLCVARAPVAAELAELLRLYRRAVGIYREQPQAARALAESGLPEGLPRDVSLPQLAGWITVANVLLNLDESLVKY